MIADWTVEAGNSSPSIDVPWEGWTDLRWTQGGGPDWDVIRAGSLAECQAYPELLEVLKPLNWLNTATSKLDVFPVTTDDADPEIAEAGEVATRYGLGSYLDLFAIQGDIFEQFEDFESIARSTSARLNRGGDTQGLAAAEIVIRPAHIYSHATFGWTLYAMGFGPSAEAARACWHAANRKLAAVFSKEIESSLVKRIKAKHPDPVP